MDCLAILTSVLEQGIEVVVNLQAVLEGDELVCDTNLLKVHLELLLMNVLVVCIDYKTWAWLVCEQSILSQNS